MITFLSFSIETSLSSAIEDDQSSDTATPEEEIAREGSTWSASFPLQNMTYSPRISFDRGI